jgi:hypothetical protein
MQPQVPQQHSGVAKNIEEQITCNSVQQAETLYQQAAERLLHINLWHKWCNINGAVFTLKQADGTDAPNGKAAEGLWISIDIPGPGTITGSGLDWVYIDKVNQSTHGGEAITQMVVHPSSPPNPAEQDTAHFLSSESSSTFVVSQKGQLVTAAIYGRNEQLNTDTPNVIDKVRNALVYLGAVAGLSDVQWKSLAKGLLQH